MHSSYLSVIFNKKLRYFMVDVILSQLEPIAHEFDSIVASGNSMMGISPIISHYLNKNLVLVRKDSDNGHSPYKVEYDDVVGKYIIIDDFIHSGNTINYIVKSINNRSYCGHHQFYGVFLYQYMIDIARGHNNEEFTNNYITTKLGELGHHRCKILHKTMTESQLEAFNSIEL